MVRALRNPIEALRTAPVQLAGIAADLGYITTNTFVSFEIQQSTNPLLLGATAFHVGLAAFFGVLAKEKFDLRDRLEAGLERRGFDDRIMGVTTKEYCTRQAARVACENYGYSEQYAELCQRNSANAKVTWLPHV